MSGNTYAVKWRGHYGFDTKDENAMQWVRDKLLVDMARGILPKIIEGNIFTIKMDWKIDDHRENYTFPVGYDYKPSEVTLSCELVSVDKQFITVSVPHELQVWDEDFYKYTTFRYKHPKLAKLLRKLF